MLNSLADSSIPDNEMTTSQTEASNSSVSATITITWTTAVLSEKQERQSLFWLHYFG